MLQSLWARGPGPAACGWPFSGPRAQHKWPWCRRRPARVNLRHAPPAPHHNRLPGRQCSPAVHGFPERLQSGVPRASGSAAWCGCGGWPAIPMHFQPKPEPSRSIPPPLHFPMPAHAASIGARAGRLFGVMVLLWQPWHHVSAPYGTKSTAPSQKTQITTHNRQKENTHPAAKAAPTKA